MRFSVYKTSALFSPLLIALLALFSSCSVSKNTRVKNYPVGIPFMYENNIQLTGTMTKDEKKRLTNDLADYWDDSLQVKRLQKFGFFYKLDAPPVFDSANITRSINFMNAYLNSQGYYYATFKDSVRIDSVKDQLRTTVTILIDAGKNITIDSVSFNLEDSNLQKITAGEQKNTLLKTGTPYSKELINRELDRLVSVYRQNGYYFFTREDIRAVVDSFDTRLLTLTLDPFKQAQIIAEAARNRRIDPKWDVAILKRPTLDSNKLTQYHVGRLYFYPETKLADIPDSLVALPDSVLAARGFQELRRRDMTMRYKKGLFNYKVMREHNYMRRGELYNENNFYKTINTLGNLDAWQQVDGRPVPRGKDSLDIYFFMVPNIKQSYALALEGSRNTTDIATGNLWGLATNLDYTNRNVWKRAIQSITTLRTGVELNILNDNTAPLVQTFLANIGQTYYIPKLILPFKGWAGLNKLDNKRTIFSINGSYVDRRDYYYLRSLVTNWGYEWKKNNNIWLYKPLNIELYGLTSLPKLDTLKAINPFLKYSFQEGNIISQTLSFVKTFNGNKNPDKTHYISTGVEEAGFLFGWVPGLKDKIYRYIKVQAEYRQKIQFRKTDLAWRVFAGLGYNYGSDSLIGKTLPFFKQFFAGGPYSMRAWGLRQLGLGSSKFFELDTTANAFRDRFGDMQLEANIEYRFPLTTVAGIKLTSAVFMDIGNIWNLKSSADVQPGQPDLALFHFSRLYKDLAIAAGTGLRIDFSYFLVRLDVAYKVKDPGRYYNDGWMKDFSLHEYRPNGVKINNAAVQLGIGLPF
jgi:outer membrane protein insertion porin family